MYTDIHCHLNFKDYGSVEELVNNCLKDGVDKIVTVGFDAPSSEECKKNCRVVRQRIFHRRSAPHRAFALLLFRSARNRTALFSSQVHRHRRNRAGLSLSRHGQGAPASLFQGAVRARRQVKDARADTLARLRRGHPQLFEAK